MVQPARIDASPAKTQQVGPFKLSVVLNDYIIVTWRWEATVITKLLLESVKN